MNDITNNILEQDISELFGYADMTAEEKTALLDNIGAIILESSTLRFMVESSVATITQFEKIIEAHAEDETMLEVLIETFPRFAEIVEEEVTAFKKEANATLAV